MAEAWAKELASDVMEIYSAGTEEYHEVKLLAVKVMEEVGVNMDEQYPKLLKDIPQEVDYLITMGCNVICPVLPNVHNEDWRLEDPSGGPIEDYRETRDLIKKKVEKLIEKIKSES